MAAASQDTIYHLNAVLRHKLTGINQYFLHARMLKHQGQMELADAAYRTSINSMKYSDMLVEMILSLGGKPNMQDMGSLMIGDNAAQMLECDLAHAEATLQHIKAGQAASAAENQTGAAALLARMADAQQEQVRALRQLQTEFPTSPNQKDCA
jgi:bacterioferritin